MASTGRVGLIQRIERTVQCMPPWSQIKIARVQAGSVNAELLIYMPSAAPNAAKSLIDALDDLTREQLHAKLGRFSALMHAAMSERVEVMRSWPMLTRDDADFYLGRKYEAAEEGMQVRLEVTEDRIGAYPKSMGQPYAMSP